MICFCIQHPVLLQWFVRYCHEAKENFLTLALLMLYLVQKCDLTKSCIFCVVLPHVI